MRVMRAPSLMSAALISSLIASVAYALPAFAASYSSSDYTARSTSVGSLGGTSTSTDYSLYQVGGQVAGGTSTSSTFQVNSGSSGLSTFSPEGGNWRWYDDASDVTPTSALAAEDVAPSDVASTSVLKLRWTIKDASSVGDTDVKFRLQFATSSDFTNAKYVAEQGACTTGSGWCYANGAGTDNGVITTGVLSDSDACVSGTGTGCGTHNESGTSTSTFTQQGNAATEYEFTLKPSGAATGTVYFFRAILATATTSVALPSGASYPSLAIWGGTLSFAIDGVPSATTTGAVTTTVDTTSTSVPFGTLSFSGSSVAANRLVVSTDASAGYEIYAYQRQNLINQSSVEIPPVLGTNSVPQSWSSGCEATSTGCWGYHSSAAVLSGGSTRFAPDDTYAQFTSVPDEVAYSASPVTDQSTDIVYRLSVSRQQEPGAYSTQLVYIVTPVF